MNLLGELLWDFESVQDKTGPVTNYADFPLHRFLLSPAPSWPVSLGGRPLWACTTAELLLLSKDPRSGDL